MSGGLFHFRKTEIPLLVSLGSLHFLIILSFTLARIARDGLFLAELPASNLPYVYLGVAGWTALAVYGFGKFTAKRAAHNTLSFALCSTGFSLILFALWFPAAPRVAAVAFYLWSGAYGLILISQFWILVNERVNPREAKRLFAMIGAAGITGGLTGGGAATFLGGSVGTDWILVIAAALHAAAAILSNRSGVKESEKAPLLADRRKAARGGFREALSKPYVRLLVALFLVGGICSTVLDYEFKFFLQKHFAESGRITSLLGGFYGAQNVIALAAQLGLAGFVLSRFGPRSAALALPVGILAGSVATLFSPFFLLVLSTRLYDATLRVSISRTAWEFLYFPLSDHTRRLAKRLIDVAVARSADAGAGLLILLLNTTGNGGMKEITLAVTVLTAGWLALEFAVSRSYRLQASRPLHRSVSIRTQAPSPVTTWDPSTDWVALLESEDESRVLYALEVLRNGNMGAVREKSSLLLHHPSPTVRARALAMLIAGGANVEGLEWETGFQRDGASGEAMADMSLEETTADRVAVAAAAGRELGSPIPRNRLRELIDDPERDVRVTAMRSAGLTRDGRFVPALIDRLEKGEDRKDARESLTLYGDRIVGLLGDRLVDDSVSPATRVEIARVLAAIGSQDAAYSLFRAGHLGTNRIVMNQVLRSLNQIRLKNPAVSLPWKIVRERLDGEILRYCQRLVQQRAVLSIENEDVRRLLGRVINERTAQSLERIFRRLALVYPTRDTLLAHRGYLGRNRRLRAQSIEYLDSILEKDHKKTLLPVLEESSFNGKVRRAGFVLHRGSPSVYGTIMELLESREAWLRAIGLFVVGSTKLDIHLDLVYDHMKSSDPIIRDTARWAMEKLTVAGGEGSSRNALMN